MPAYEVVETHETRVRAPGALTHAVMSDVGLDASPLVRAIIHAHERLLRVGGGAPWPAGGIAAQLRAWGWGVLPEVAGRAVVLGAVTQPWEGDVRFRALPPDEFTTFDRPGFVKIVVAISVDSTGPESSVARVQTRVATTDPTARARFRRYWAAFPSGIVLIRRAMLREIRHEAERRHRAARAPEHRAATADSVRARRPTPMHSGVRDDRASRNRECRVLSADSVLPDAMCAGPSRDGTAFRVRHPPTRMPTVAGQTAGPSAGMLDHDRWARSSIAGAAATTAHFA